MEIRDPVCGMIVDDETAPEQSIHDGTIWYFCSRNCKKAFDENPEEYVAEVPQSSR